MIELQSGRDDLYSLINEVFKKFRNNDTYKHNGIVWVWYTDVLQRDDNKLGVAEGASQKTSTLDFKRALCCLLLCEVGRFAAQ